ncbi:MAG: histidine triad nucleotide-binding protein [Nitrospirota bacterium]|nr:histidine triad nucleotide-binding protein [Nitrospirota bacterium]
MKDCLFCKIVRGEIPANKVHEDERAIAFEDIGPQAPTHTLVIPKEHLSDQRGIDESRAELMGHLIRVANQVADKKGLKSFRTVINTGAQAGQTVFHLHVHLLGGRPMNWPPG